MNKQILFYDQDFPYNGARPDHSMLSKLREKYHVVKAGELKEALHDDRFIGLVNLHGPYFPKEAWNGILQFLKMGKGLFHIGGTPFRIPCHELDGKWIEEKEQTAYHMQLNIHESLPVKANKAVRLEASKEIPLFNGWEQLLTIEDTYNFIMHVSKVSSIEHEMGSNGPMDARIYPLLKGITKDNREISAPAVLIENYRGNFTGGRWVFINQPLSESFWNQRGLEWLETATTFISNGVTEIWVKTNYASYHVGEKPIITIQHQAIHERETAWTYEVSIRKGEEVKYYKKSTVQINRYLQSVKIDPGFTVEAGFYEVECALASEAGETFSYNQGFWGRDDALLEQGEPLTCDRDYFRKDGQPFPIVGMTYMTSDVSRYFLYLPNPAVWDRDFAHMKRAGINYVRTGAWFAYRNMMFVDGHVNEEVLRALDAFILCAKKHDIYVTLCFFSFTPELWDGENPYLDPRSVEAQRRFIGTIVQRHQHTKNVNWDLINEPSMFDPQRVFAGPRTMNDRFERAAYQQWLKDKYQTITQLQENWNATPAEIPSFQSIHPPEASDINSHIQNMASGKRGLKWLDYTLFTMDMHNRWAKDLAATIKHFTPNQLVTVGQDEALAGQRPSAFFYEEAVDYTSNHTWWLMDQLLWDSIFTKTPNKPNLIQETGIMYVENPDNIAKRSEEELRNILERKYAYAFSGAGAGAVQWIWNTNYFMNNVNESNIGALRADGTEKPETDVSYQFGAFMKKVGHIFENRELEDVAVIFPYSNDFSNRRLAFDATAKLTRTLGFELNVPFRAVSEYHLQALRKDTPKLMMLPSAHNFSNEAFTELLSIVEETGATLLVTGPISLDEFWKKTDRTAHIVGETSIGTIKREEMMYINDEACHVSFPDLRIAQVMDEVPTSASPKHAVREYEVGAGKLIWCPLAIELNERIDPLKALYQYAISTAGIGSHLDWLKGDLPGIYGRKLTMGNGDLFIFVSEFGEDTHVEVRDPDHQVTYAFTLEAERSVLFAVDKQGEVIGIYRDDEVGVSTI